MAETMVRGATSEELKTLIAKGAGAADIAAHLDELDESTRLAEVRSISGSLQKKLWTLVEGKAPIAMEAFLPQTDKTIMYCGLNTLPAFRVMQKRFWRPAGGGRIVGYNHHAMAMFTGPGYFTTKQGEGGELVFDYVDLPDFQPPGWPAISANKGIIAGPVYGNMIDYAWRVSAHTVLGKATKKGKDLGQHFLMTRCDVEPPGGY